MHARQLAFRDAQSAINALEDARARLVDEGVRVAVVLCKQHGECTAQDVFARMDADGLLSEGDKAINARWLGSVFRGKAGRRLFYPCGFRMVANAERNAHSAPRTVWKLL